MDKKFAADEIWVFIEEKLHQVPAYFKTVLKVCGYNNGLSISAIEEEDLEYIKSEVRNGNVGKVFAGSQVKYLEECNKTKEDFEFVLGHKKYLLAIVDFLKKHIAENGPDSFSLNEKPSKEMVKASKNIKEKKLVLQPRKKVVDKSIPLVQHAMKTELRFQQKASTISQAILAEHRKVLLKKTINGMINLTPKLLEMDIETIKKKISDDFLTFELDEDCDDSIAIIKCVFCPKTFTAFSRPTPRNKYLWKSTNFNRHLRIVHRFEDSNSQESDDESDVESKDHIERKEKLSNLRKDLESKSESKSDIERIGNLIDLDNEKDLEKEMDLQLKCKGQDLESKPESKSDIERIGNLIDLDNEKDLEKEMDLQLNCKGQDLESKGNIERIESLIDLDNEKDLGKEIDSQLKCHGQQRETLSVMGKNAQKLLNEIPDASSSTTSESKLKLAKNGLRETPICIPILKNGYKSRHGSEFTITTHTCALDTIINSLASIYLESSHVRAQFDDTGSKIFGLIKSILNMAGKMTSQASSHVSSSTNFKKIYTIRNTILKELYVGWCERSNFKKQNDTTFIDCETGIGGLFARICMKFDNNLVSGIEEKKCKKCKAVSTKLLPFLKTTETIRNFTKINDYLNRSSAERLCITCKNKCKITTTLNNIVVLETEPPKKGNRNQKIALGNVSPVLHIDNKQYLLCAVMHFDVRLNHFVAYTRQGDNSWKCLDDLKKTEQKVDASTETNPFILCYVATARCIDFEKSIQGLKSVDPAMIPSNNLSQTMSEPREPRDLSETTTRPASSASQIDLQTDKAKLVSKKRKKNRNSSKNRKKNKFQSDSKPPA